MLVYDKEMLKSFIDYLPEATNLEQYFVALSLRAKYLPQDVKEKLGENRQEMYGQTLARNKDKLYQAVMRFDCNEEGFKSRTGFPYPIELATCYINLYTCSTMLALEEFNSTMNRNLLELAKMSMANKNIDHIVRAINNAPNLLTDCYHHAKGTAKFVDLDFDIPKTHEFIVDEFIEEMVASKVRGAKVDSRGGWHVLLERDSLKENKCNYTLALGFANKRKEFVEIEGKKEIVNNTKNSMIALPGTMQAGHKVSYVKF